MIVAGLDLSLNGTGLVILETDYGSGDTWTYHVCLATRVVPPKGVRGMERIHQVSDEVLALLRLHRVDDVAIEGYAFGKISTHAHAQGELGGAVRLALWRSGCSWWEVPPATLKKYVTGKGNAKKEAMMLAVFKRWGFEAGNSDIADAYGLAMAVAGHHMTHPRKSDTEAWAKAERVYGCVARVDEEVA